MDDWCSFCCAFVFRCGYRKGWRGAVQIYSNEMKERVPLRGRLRGINGDSATFSSNTCIDLVCELLRAGIHAGSKVLNLISGPFRCMMLPWLLLFDSCFGGGSVRRFDSCWLCELIQVPWWWHVVVAGVEVHVLATLKVAEDA
ncbi:hypothetical protein DEO72_LG5g2540 [Vigna unguiculata]|uniref:Uncharacterized protein n=1 Tax=Vigna unguiculata TaxID=3917 RepID=A0A4D6M2P2_VIGUN|nr:hypothetical protein DEO72_LG5g2540 [Vigna unguiculata]